MAVYKIFPTHDSTIYSDRPFQNSGLDEILEIKNVNSFRNYVARSLIKFENLMEVFSNLVPEGSEYKMYLKLYIASSSSLLDNLRVNAFPITKNWNNGTSKYSDNITDNSGVNWLKPTDLEYWTNEGGDYESSLHSSYILGLNSTKDINMDVTNIFQYWDGGNENNGIILKLDDGIEFNSEITSQPQLSYFSSNTHTIYPPHIEIKWDDSVWDNVSSLKEIEDSELFINISNNRGEYNEGVINKFRVNVRPKYPKRTYKIKSDNTLNYVLPENACYAIKDVSTNEYIINFDNKFTKLSCDKKGNFFNLYMEGLQPERYYEIIIKFKLDEEVIVYNNKMYFKVKRNIYESPYIPNIR